MGKISIIVPVYNVEPYLPSCLDSLVGQSLKEIEIICVDDCSTDGSKKILNDYADKYKNIKVISYDINKSAAKARKDSVMAAKGKYIMFVDADDRLRLNACDRLYNLMEEYDVSMIHFGTTVEAKADIPANRLRALKKTLRPYGKKIEDENLIDYCFVDKKFYFQLWNKIYKSDLCKKAFSHFPDKRLSKAQDLLAFYMIAYFSKSYLGINNEDFYVYCFGRGITGNNKLSRSMIDRYADHVLISEEIASFLKRQNTFEKYKKSYMDIEATLFKDSIEQMFSYIDEEDILYTFDKFAGAWGPERILGEIARRYYYRKKSWVQLLSDSKYIKSKPRETKHIATYYHSLRHGGVQRVMAMLVELWIKMGYEVVVFTDEGPTDEDYQISAEIKRIILPGLQPFDKEKLSERFKLLYDSLKDNKIDMFVYHAWLSPLLPWDMLTIKSSGVHFYVHTHSIYSIPLLINTPDRLIDSPTFYSLADGVIVLSETDKAYWRCFNDNVFVVTNPIPFDPKKISKNSLKTNNILWVGRISKEKKPLQAIEIFSKVLKDIPDARLIMLGSGDKNLENKMRKTCSRLNINEKVEFCGFQKDVESYYKQADIFLSTSSYEGFPLTIAEAQAFGLPCFVYDMPYLSILESKEGSISVRQNDVSHGAKEIIKLLKERDKLVKIGNAAKKNIEALASRDFHKMWKNIIDSTNPRPIPYRKENLEINEANYEKIMIETLLTHLEMALTNKNKLSYQNHENSLTPLGPSEDRILNKIRRKINTLFLLYREYGVIATFKIVLERILKR